MKKFQEGVTKKPNLVNLLPYLVGKKGFVFSDESYVELKPILEAEIVKQPAKAGAIAPCNVWLRCGNTNQDPGKITEFQNLGIQVKAVKGSLEIIKDFLLCEKGTLVTETVSHMCRMLGIIPFEYAMELQFVYVDGNIIPQEIISLTPEDIIKGFSEASTALTAISLGAGLPNSLSVPHMITGVFKNLLSIGISADYKFKQLTEALEAKNNAPVASSNDNKKTENAPA